MHLSELWIMIEGHERNMRQAWEMTRAIAFNVAIFGYTDKKKLAKTPHRFWPFPWDEQKQESTAKEIMKQHAIIKARRQELEKRLNNKIIE